MAVDRLSKSTKATEWIYNMNMTKISSLFHLTPQMLAMRFYSCNCAVLTSEGVECARQVCDEWAVTTPNNWLMEYGARESWRWMRWDQSKNDVTLFSVFSAARLACASRHWQMVRIPYTQAKERHVCCSSRGLCFMEHNKNLGMCADSSGAQDVRNQMDFM